MTQYLESSFTKNKILLTEKVVVKCCDTARSEAAWYLSVKDVRIDVPFVYFSNDDTIVMERIYGTKPTAEDMVDIINLFQSQRPIYSTNPQTYIDNLDDERLRDKFSKLPKFDPTETFFHGDLSTTNVIMQGDRPYLIDPNIKLNVFGNYQTDAAKAIFSFLVFEQDLVSAKIIAAHHIPEIWLLAAAEGSRVAKYNPKYRTFVNNILDIYESL